MLEFLKGKIITIEGNKIDLLSIILFVLILLFAYFFAIFINYLVRKELLKKHRIDKGLIDTILRFNKYFILLIGFFASFQVLGINLSSFAFLAGVLGLGIGFGMQNIISNFVSGIIILFERPIKRGEYVEVAGLDGVITEIRARSTTITTRDNISIIVPNSNFITSNVINWSHADPKIRLHIPVGIEETSSKLDLAKSILLDVAKNHPKVLEDPAPSVWFRSFGESTFNLELLIWVASPIYRHYVISDINFEIAKQFFENNIDIAYPYRNIIFKNELATRKPENISHDGEAK